MKILEKLVGSWELKGTKFGIEINGRSDSRFCLQNQFVRTECTLRLIGKRSSEIIECEQLVTYDEKVGGYRRWTS